MTARAFVAVVLAVLPQAGASQSQTLRGWLSDEQCARSRAAAGTYTATSPRCAKECVAKGKKVVLILTDRKQILNLANQSVAKQNVGDYVEVTGDLDGRNQTLRIDSLKMITQGRAMCDLPRH